MNPRRTIPTFVALVFAVFGMIGVAVIVFLWSQRSGDFGAPPLMFRVIGSGIGLMFVLMGFGTAISALAARRQLDRTDPGDSMAGEDIQGSPGYKCTQCGAGLGKQEVSPLGDVKCSHCGTWWNIHGRR